MITPLSTPPSRSDPANFSSRADTFLGQLPTFASEANSLAADVNSKQSIASAAASTATLKAAEAVTSASNASTSASNASTSASNASTSATTAQNWAIKTDGPVTGSEYSAKYWGQIAQGFVIGTLFDDSTTSSVKTWTSNKINSFAVPKFGGGTLTGGQYRFEHSGGNPANASSYSVRLKYWGNGIVFEDTGFASIFTDFNTTQLKIGFGADGSITSKFTFSSSGDFTSAGQVNCTSLNATSTGSIVDTMTIASSGSEAKCIVSKSGQNNAYLYNNATSWGLYSNSGGSLVRYERAANKRFFADIAEDDIWKFSAGTVSLGTSGYTRLPNGLIIQWGKTSLAADHRPITFPYTFPNGVLTCNAIKSSTGTWGPFSGISFNKITNSGAEIGCSESSNTVYWSVIGY